MGSVKGNKNRSKAEKRRNKIRIIQAIIALILVLGMIVTSIIVYFAS